MENGWLPLGYEERSFRTSQVVCRHQVLIPAKLLRKPNENSPVSTRSSGNGSRPSPPCSCARRQRRRHGRTGRAVAQSMLLQRGVTPNVAVPVSAGLFADVEGYHAALTAYRAGEVDPIVLLFAAASLRAVHNARHLVEDIDGIRESWNQRLSARRNSNAWKLLDVLARRPVLNSAAAASELGVQQPNVYPPLRALVEAGIAKSKAEHQLGPFWRSDEVLAAIDAFAERAGRRSAV